MTAFYYTTRIKRAILGSSQQVVISTPLSLYGWQIPNLRPLTTVEAAEIALLERSARWSMLETYQNITIGVIWIAERKHADISMMLGGGCGSIDQRVKRFNDRRQGIVLERHVID